MNSATTEQLIQLITAEVLRTMGGSIAPEPADKSGLPHALVVGDFDALPDEFARKHQLLAVEDGKACSMPYEKVLITGLSLAELADIALGRDASPAACAVIDALLQGKEVLLFECALAHRKLAGKGSRAFYQLLEGYVRTLQSFGIAVVQRQARTGIYNPPEGLPDGIITEAVAAKLVEQSGDSILLRKGTVVTPSAKDVFLHGGKQLTFV